MGNTCRADLALGRPRVLVGDREAIWRSGFFRGAGVGCRCGVGGGGEPRGAGTCERGGSGEQRRPVKVSNPSDITLKLIYPLMP